MFYKETVFEITLGGLDGGVLLPLRARPVLLLIKMTWA